MENNHPPIESDGNVPDAVSAVSADPQSSAIDRWLHLKPDSSRKAWVYWRPQILDFHLLKEFLMSWMMVLVAMIFMFTIQILMSELEDIVKIGLTFSQTITYLFLNLPYLLMYMVPVSLLVSLIYTLVTLAKNNEIVAMRACGIAMERIAMPIVLMALAASGLLLLMNRNTTADYTDRSRQMLIQGERNEAGDLIRRKVQYFQGSQFRFWYIKMFNVTRLTAEDVEITEQDAEGRDIRKIYARKAAYVNNEWQLFDIREIYFDEKNGDSRAENISARNYSDFIETPRQMLASNNKDIEGMTSNEIRDYIAQNKSYRSSRLAPYFTTLYYRYAMPFWCLAIALFTIPFAASVTKRDPIAGIAYPFILFIAFFFMTNFSLALGKGSRLPPSVGAWSAVIVFSIIGVYFIFKKR